jgi:hypothetical protein
LNTSNIINNLINWYIDNRQIENGEFGGGLSDDGDFTAMWVGLTQMGCDPDGKVLHSLEHCTDAFYKQGMVYQRPSLHPGGRTSFRGRGLIALGQCLTADFANPKYLERDMETARSCSGSPHQQGGPPAH